MEYGADPNIRLNRENDEMTVSMMLCNRIDNLQLADTNSRLLILLLSKGADITIRDSQGRTALHYAWGRKNSHLIDVIRSQTCDQIYVEALQSQGRLKMPQWTGFRHGNTHGRILIGKSYQGALIIITDFQKKSVQSWNHNLHLQDNFFLFTISLFNKCLIIRGSDWSIV